MKILVFIIFGFILYIALDKLAFKNKNQQKYRKWIVPGVFIFTVSLFMIGAFLSSMQPDNQCTGIHKTSTNPPTGGPTSLVTAQDYFDSANYKYDSGECSKAVIDYSQAIRLNPKFAESYNNRGYTYMRMGDYANALSDLDMAITLRPNYVNALMNRGDIYNYYLNNKAKAIEDYNKVLTTDPAAANSTSVCGHLMLAVNNGWHLRTIFSILQNFPPRNCSPVKI